MTNLLCTERILCLWVIIYFNHAQYAVSDERADIAQSMQCAAKMAAIVY